MKTLTALSSILLCAALLLGCAQSDKKISLRFKYEAGLRTAYEQHSKRSWKVVSGDSVIEEGSRGYDARVVQIVSALKPAGAAEIIDSSMWYYEVRNKDDSSKVDTSVTTRVTLITAEPNGRIINMEFLSKESSSAAKWLKNYYEQGMPVFPKGEVSQGYSWTQTTKVLLPDETLDASITFKIKAMVREAGYDCALIEYDGNLVIPVEPSESDPLKRQGLDRIHASGNFYFAYREGLIVLQREHWSQVGERVRIKEGKKESYTISTESKVDFRLVEKSAL